jgi:hypothetical protein
VKRIEELHYIFTYETHPTEIGGRREERKYNRGGELVQSTL